MAPTTTALTVFKATLSTQSKDLISKNKNSNEDTSTLCKANVVTTTSPAVPQATVESEDTRPSPPGISAEGTSPLNQEKDRDARAYEHERQRAKHAGEWARRRARKAAKGGVGRASAGRQVRSKKVGLDVDVDVYAVTPQGKYAERSMDGLGAGLLKRVSLPLNGEGGTGASEAVPGVKVNLSEIMVLSQRKPRKNGMLLMLVPSLVDQLEKLEFTFCFPVDDFEVIPNIRSVIALDDVANVHDMDLDETWEHIYANGEGKTFDSKSSRLSYARVAGTGCQ